MLLYACHYVHLSQGSLKELDVLQAKMVKSYMGLQTSAHSTPLLKALGLLTISQSISVSTLELLRSCVLSTSKTGSFYAKQLFCAGKSAHNRTLLGRAHKIAESKNVRVVQYIFDDKYRQSIKCQLQSRTKNGTDGLVDSIRTLISDYTPTSCKTLGSLLRSY